MKMIDIQQGSSDWHTHRAAHFNASDCAAMLGISPYKTRDELLREKATGLVPEVDEATRRRFDEGHRFEALARPLAEEIIGDELYPCVGVLEGSKLSASFDGITMDGSIVWEHKTLNESLRQLMQSGAPQCHIPPHYRAQLEQQLLVSGAEKALFMASTFDEAGELVESLHLWYQSDTGLREYIIQGWAQFEKDLAEYQPQPLPLPKPAGKAPESLPALHIQATGKVLASNLDTFKQQAFAVLDSINRDLQTDDDFANAEATSKWCKQIEQKLEATKQHVLSQTADIEAVFRTIDEVSEHTRKIRLELEKLTKREKENRKLELVERADKAIFDHCQVLNARLAEHDDALGFACVIPQPFEPRRIQLAAAIKGLRTLESMQSALNTVVAEHKIAADADYRRIEANIKIALLARERFHLFPDMQGLIETKPTDDLQNLITARIADAERAERERQERERQEQELAEDLGEAGKEYPPDYQDRLRLDALEGLARSEAAVQRLLPAHPQVQQLAEVYSHPAGHAHERPDAEPRADDTLIRLSDIKDAIAPLSISEAGLSQLGFSLAGHERNAKLYRTREFPHMIQAMTRLLHAATIRPADAQWRAVVPSPQAA